MEYYGKGNHNVLPSVLKHLYNAREMLLRQGMLLTILPGGEFRGIVPSSNSADYTGDYYTMIRAGGSKDISREIPQDPAWPTFAPAGSPKIGQLAFGFRMTKSEGIVQGTVPFLTQDSHVRGEPSTRSYAHMPKMTPVRFSVPRDGFDQFDVETFVEGMMWPIWSCENNACLEALDQLYPFKATFKYGGSQTLTHLWGFVRKMNDEQGGMELDTVFINHAVFNSLISEGIPEMSAIIADNVIDHMGVRIIGHERIPENVAYVTSHMYGPLFITGPTTITCTDDEFTVGRYCSVVSPPTNAGRAKPYGFKASIAMTA